VTCHRLAGWPAKQRRVQRLAVSEALWWFDGDQSPAKSDAKASHSKVPPSRRNVWQKDGGRIITRTTAVQPRMDTDAHGQSVSPKQVAAERRTRGAKVNPPGLWFDAACRIWSAVTCHRFGRLAGLPAKQSRVQRLAVSEAHGWFDGDQSPAKSDAKAAHFKAPPSCRNDWQKDGGRIITRTTGVQPRMDTDAHGQSVSPKHVAAERRTRGAKVQSARALV